MILAELSWGHAASAHVPKIVERREVRTVASTRHLQTVVLFSVVLLVRCSAVKELLAW